MNYANKSICKLYRSQAQHEEHPSVS